MSSSDVHVLPPGTRLAQRYVLGELVGGGGMAQVYRGLHEGLRLPVAIKILTPACMGLPNVVARFLREARAASKVRHDNIVQISDFGETDDERPFMVMEYLEGEDLADTLFREGPLPWKRVRLMLLQILAALHAAHARSVIHRDMKPENVFRVTRLGNEDFLKVFDFGIAKVLGEAGNPLTLEGSVVGTPTHMSPEQCMGLEVDARSDLYAVGILGYEMLTGRVPFDYDEPTRLLFAHVHEQVPAMADVAPHVWVDRRAEAIIVRALQKRPEDRYASARELAEVLLEDVDPQEPGLLQSLRRSFER
jgi:serine/threonine protein kinase